MSAISSPLVAEAGAEGVSGEIDVIGATTEAEGIELHRLADGLLFAPEGTEIQGWPVSTLSLPILESHLDGLVCAKVAKITRHIECCALWGKQALNPSVTV